MTAEWIQKAAKECANRVDQDAILEDEARNFGKDGVGLTLVQFDLFVVQFEDIIQRAYNEHVKLEDMREGAAETLRERVNDAADVREDVAEQKPFQLSDEELER